MNRAFFQRLLLAGLWLGAGRLSAQPAVTYPHLPLAFEANRGQAPAGVRYISRGPGHGLYLGPDEAILTLPGARRGEPARPLHLRLEGANRAAQIVALDPLPGKSHYLIGRDPKNWITNVPQYARVAYRNVYEGIDLVYHGDSESNGRLEYDFVVAPGADPAQILLAFGTGAATAATIDALSGDLLLAAADQSVMRQLRPRIFQDIAGKRREIPGRYEMAANHQVKFALGDYDHAHELVIDPVILYGTVLPGSGADAGLAVAADSSGNAYVTGYTTSSDFLTASAWQPQPIGGKEVFVTKVNAAGTALVYSTYIGGSGDDVAQGIAVDSSGNAYITGYTESLDFPTVSPLQASLLGTRNAFVAELNASGSALVYSTFLGGSNTDQANAIVVDPTGAAYVTGATSSTNFPVISPLRATLKGTTNAFITKIKPAGTGITWSTYLGGSGVDVARAITLDSSYDVYITGSTNSPDFPTSQPLQSTNAGSGDVFISEIVAAGNYLFFSTYYGGAGQDDGYGIALDSSGPNIYVSGFTSSIASFPQVNAMPAPQLTASGFLLKINGARTAVTYSMIVNDTGRALAVDAFGNAYLSYASRINPSGTALDFSVPVSGTIPAAIALDTSGNVYITGQGATLVSPLATPKDFYDVSLIKIGEAAAGPRISYLSPATAAAGTAGATLHVFGSGFGSGYVVKWNGSARATTVANNGEVDATLTTADLSTAGTNTITVVSPSNAVSNPATFTVLNGVAGITALSPSSASAGGAAFTLTVNGTGFLNGVTVYFNGSARTTTYVSSTQVTAAITAADITASGTATVQVLVPGPGGGLSAASSFSVNNPTPAISSLSPTSAATSGADFTLTVLGTGFTSSSVVRWNGASRATTFVSKLQLRATIVAADIAAAGTNTVTVFNPTPGGGTSAGATFVVSGNPVPAVTATNPASVNVGSGATVVTLTGTGFLTASQIQWNGANRTTSYVSATQLTASLSASDFATATTANITVVNPTPGGGTSVAMAFPVNNPAPAVTTISPSTMAATSSAFTLTINGTGFNSASQVQWNGANRTTTYVSAMQLTAAIPATDVAASGTASVTVVNAAPGGGTSTAASLAITSNPLPIVTLILPATTSANSGAFALTVTGTGFIPTSQIQWNGANRVTSYVSATQLTAAILSSDVSAAATAAITVVNSAPGGGTSASVPFTVTSAATPSVASVLPASANVGSSAFTLTVTGSAFVSASQVQWNGSPRTTTFVSNTQLTAAITAADIAASGTATVAVSNPGGVVSPNATFTISNPTPSITGISPSTIAAASSAFTLTVNGSGFVATSQVTWNGANRTTTYVNATQVTAAIAAADVASAGAATIAVVNPAPGGGASGGSSLTITANPAPSLASILPTSAINNSGAFSLTVSGTSFIPASQVQWNGASRVTTYVSATQLTAAITAADLASVGTATVTVVNPAPGGGTSPGISFSVAANPAPVVNSILPSSASIGSSAMTLTVVGTGFIAGSVVQWNGASRTTTYVSTMQLTAAIPATDLSSAGTASVTVMSPTPGGGTSASSGFSITANPTPSIASILPASANVGAGAFTLTVTGTGFASSSLVRWNGANRATTFISSTQLTAAITAGDLTSSGTATITVINPTDGGTSGGATFTIGNPSPAIASLTPASVTSGGAAFTLSISGTGFVATSVVNWNAAARATTYVSGTQLTAAITAADIAAASTATVTVVNPTPGGGASAGVSLPVTANPVPVVASILPASATAGASAFVLTVTGSGFISGSQVQWNGANRTTTYVSATQVTAAITAADLTSAGSSSVTVANPAPGGGTSASASFTVNNPTPAISTISPASVVAGASAFTLTVTGTGFATGATLQWNGANRTTTLVSATQVTAAITAADVASAGAAVVVVVNPGPGGGSSFGVSLTINAAGNPIASITSISPSTATVGAALTSITVTGTNFLASSQAEWNGSNRTTTYVSSTQLMLALSTADLASSGASVVTVVNPAPGGGTSLGATFTINNPVAAVTALAPSSATAGAASFTLNVTGTGFVPASVVAWNGANRVTSYVSATQLSASITGSDVATAGTAQVTVVNPAPGGGASPASSFTINTAGNPAPSITTVSPATANVSVGPITLTVNGSGFISTSQVQWNGVARATTFVSATQLTAAILAGDTASVGTDTVTVANPTPGGGTSSGVSFTVTANPAPVLASILPASATVGAAAQTLTVTGSGFLATSQVQWNGVNRATTFVSSTQLTAAILASDFAAAATPAVTVVNPTPGGGSSASLAFTITNVAPAMSSVSPAATTAGVAAFTLTVNGSGFVAASAVQWNGSSRTTTFVSATQLTAAIAAADVAASGTATITVSTPAPGGGTSPGLSFVITANPTPAITTIQPASATINSGAFTLIVNGSGFVAASVVNWNGSPRATTLLSATQLSAAILSGDIAATGSATVTVATPAPGGGTSTSLPFAITSNPVPSVASIIPASANAGSSAQTLTVTGSGFIATSQVLWNGANRTTTYISSTQLTAAITATDLATAGTASVSVSNPAPGGGTSSAASFAINNPTPVILSLSPSTTTAGSPAFTLTINGSGFVATSQVQWNGANRVTTFVSATQLTAAIAGADIASAGSATIIVGNPTPGGGTSAASTLTITANPVPVLSAIQPSSASINSGAFTMTLSGSSFVAGSTVQWNGASRTTTFISATQLSAAISATDLATAGTASVWIANPAPGGGSSAAQTFTITPNPVPTVASILPSSANAGSSSLTITVTGGSFVAGSTVQWNGASRATTFISSTQLTATITTSDLSTAGTFAVTVMNPTPGGGASTAASFSVNNAAPAIAAIAPTSAATGGSAFTLTVTGAGFLAASQVMWNGASRTTTYVSATQLTASITAADLSTAGLAAVTVVNPAPGGGASSSATFTIASNPVPSIASLLPSSASAGGADFTLTLTGNGFVPSSIVLWNGVQHTPTYISATQLTVLILAADIGNAGAVPVTVFNPAPAGGTSAAIAFAVNNPAPVVSGISPSVVASNTAAFTVTVTGTGFVPTSQVQWNGANRATTYVSSTQLSGAINGGDVVNAGANSITVVNLAPGGGTSSVTAASILTVTTNPVPAIASLLPASAAVNTTSFTLTVTGSGFTSASQLQWNGTNRATTYISATQLTAAIGASDLVTASSALVTIVNPAPGGGTSPAQTFTINNPAPSLTLISPVTAAVASTGFTLTLNGSGFVGASQVQWNGSVRPTSFVSSTQLTATIGTSDLATSGTVTVTVVNPTPGGGASVALPFTITANPVPSIVSLTPASIAVNSGGFTLTVSGTGFVSGSQLQWNGVARNTTVVSSTQLTAPVLAADVNAATSIAVTVLNPAPGGGTSAATTFAVTNPTPAVTTLTPSTVAAGAAATSLVVTGSGFVASSMVQWNGVNISTAYVNATQLNAMIPAAALTAPASAMVTVASPTPGGGSSTTAAFTITGNPTPSLAGLLPASAAIGSGSFTLAVLGAGFTPQSQVQFNGVNRVTTYVSTTEVTAAILASDLSAVGSATVTVSNPSPGGGMSNPGDIFTITAPVNPVPAVATLSPPSALVNGASFTMTLTGTGFLSSSQVQWNGVNLATTYVSATQLTVTVPTTNLTIAGSFPVTVNNPLPGGGTSNSTAFPVDLACTYVLTPPASAFAAAISSGSVTVAAAPGCVWSAAALDSFITLPGAVSGSGNGTVVFSLAANASSARNGTIVIAGQNVVISQSGTVQGVVASAPASAAVAGSVRIPVTLVASSGVVLDKIAFSLQVTPVGVAPALSTALSFTADVALGTPSTTDTSGGTGLISVSWLGLSSNASGTQHLGDVTVAIPAGTSVGQTYAVKISGASGSYKAGTVSLAAGSDSVLTIRLDYLVGDIFPFTTDAAGNFGDAAINTLDLLSGLRAVTGVTGYVPAACSDRFDAMDAYPADTATARGGDGFLNTLDLLAILQKVTNADPTRPRRVARGLSCGQSASLLHLPKTPAAATLQMDSTGAVYLTSDRDVSFDGLAFSMISSGEETLQWKPAAGYAPSLLDNDLPGILALALMHHIDIAAGDRILLGRAIGASSIKMQGASGHFGVSDVRVAVAASSANLRNQ